MNTNKRTARTAKAEAAHVADICLFGTSRTGAGFIAVAFPHGQTVGDGTPRQGRTFTEAVWIAVGGIEVASGHKSGRVRVFAPGGERVAWMELERPRIFGDLKWEPAPVLVISSEQLEAAASEVFEVKDGVVNRIK